MVEVSKGGLRWIKGRIAQIGSIPDLHAYWAGNLGNVAKQDDRVKKLFKDRERELDTEAKGEP